MNKTAENYEPYSEEWVKEIMKMPKKFIIENLLKPALIKKSEVANRSLPSGVTEQQLEDMAALNTTGTLKHYDKQAASACTLITIEEMKGFAEWLGNNGFIPAFNKSGINEIISNYLNQKHYLHIFLKDLFSYLYCTKRLF